jgi:hypothetical protein
MTVRVVAAEGLDGFGTPDAALLRQCPRFVLAVSGLQRGLLSQLQHVHPARRPAMITGEVGGEFGLSDVDDLSPCRPALVQPRINADDLPDRALRAVPAWPFGEPHPEERGEVVLQRGVVRL